MGGRAPRRTRKQRGKCKKPNGVCLPDSTAGRAHEGRTVEMPGHGGGGKPTPGFPPPPPPLEIAARFPHSHRPGDAVEKWKAESRLPTFPLRYSPPIKTSIRKEAWQRVASLPSFQAHSSLTDAYSYLVCPVSAGNVASTCSSKRFCPA